MSLAMLAWAGIISADLLIRVSGRASTHEGIVAVRGVDENVLHAVGSNLAEASIGRVVSFGCVADGAGDAGTDFLGLSGEEGECSERQVEFEVHCCVGSLYELSDWMGGESKAESRRM